MFAECVALQRKEEEKGDLVMRTLILTLAVVLLAAPVWAEVEITLSVEGKVVTIGYDASGEGQLVRAFALDITAVDGNIIDVNDYAIGDDSGGYGIFPGTFASANVVVNATTGQVDDWNVVGYSPVAPAGDPDALGGIGTTGVTIEMGSLYDTAGPDTTGVLCTITVDENATEVCVTSNAIRGNVVLESAAEVQNLILSDCIPVNDVIDCFPSTFGAYDDWVASGKPDCWCGPGTGADSIPDEHLGYQCDGDAASDVETFFKYRVFGNDLAAVVANWKRQIDDVDLDPCADFDHKSETFFKYRVFGKDLAIVVGNWKLKDADLPGDCPRDE
jgi:hypothetical protein